MLPEGKNRGLQESAKPSAGVWLAPPEPHPPLLLCVALFKEFCQASGDLTQTVQVQSWPVNHNNRGLGGHNAYGTDSRGE